MKPIPCIVCGNVENTIMAVDGLPYCSESVKDDQPPVDLEDLGDDCLIRSAEKFTKKD